MRRRLGRAPYPSDQPVLSSGTFTVPVTAGTAE
jgi:hypothetical protein